MFRTFREFVEAPLFKGLGEKLSDIERLIADDAESLVRLRALIVAGRGNPTGNNQYGNGDNITISTDLFVAPESTKRKTERGTSRAYTLVRLKNERPDLFDRVVAKELTANRAAVETTVQGFWDSLHNCFSAFRLPTGAPTACFSARYCFPR